MQPTSDDDISECATDRTVLWARPPDVAMGRDRDDRPTCCFTRAPRPRPAGLWGELLDGRYRLVTLLKRGGMGELYAAEHVTTGRRVAVKVLREAWYRDPIIRERLRREAAASARVAHPHIVETLDFGVTPEGLCYLVMELLYGEDLQATLRRQQRLSLARASAIMLQICGALAAVHAAGIVHRDVKPANCFRVGFKGVDDFMKLVDFGLARRVPPPGCEDSPLTAVGSVLGTSFYMSPEQVSGEVADHRADIYAAGVLLYQLVTGRPPFRGKGAAEIFRQILADPPPSARSCVPGLPPAFDELIHRAMAKHPDARFQAMDELIAAIATLPVIPVEIARTAPAISMPRPRFGRWLSAALPVAALLAALAAAR